MNIATLRTRIDRLIARIDNKPTTWAFVLLHNQEIPPETLERIGPHDTVYVKRIVLTHLESAA